MIVDLHAHFPMHLDAQLKVISPGTPREYKRRGRKPRSHTLIAVRRMHRHGRKRRFGDWFRALILNIADRIDNYRKWDAKPGVTMETLTEGHVGVALSVLYQPFCEMDLEHFEQAPRADYFDDLLAQVQRVEDAVAADPGKHAVVVRNWKELDEAVKAGQLAFVHVVEGGFHLGNTAADIAANVATLAQRGVAYITVAHLFWRQVASNAPAVPFLSDTAYRRVFPEPDTGLTELGRALVDEMAKHRILVDVTHMTQLAMYDTFDRLPRGVPVLASHMACRFGSFGYNLTDDFVRKIADRGGVMGIILCDHYSNEGRQQTSNMEQSFDAVFRQVDRILQVAGSHEHTAIGTDLDGFIKPTLFGLSDSSCMPLLETALENKYGKTVAEQICSKNALRLLESYW